LQFIPDVDNISWWHKMKAPLPMVQLSVPSRHLRRRNQDPCWRVLFSAK
jgi:hypothetical protein